jgi:hypothetical protein
MATALIAGVICSHPKNLNPRNGKPPFMIFNLCESDGRVWRVMALDECELGCERLVFGDAVSVCGLLDVRAECDREGRKRIGFHLQAKQILFLRPRSTAKAFYEQPAVLNGYTRSRVG